MRAARKNKVQPSQTNRKKAKPKRQPALWHTAATVGRAVQKAEVASWHPYQLRHNFATKVCREYGLEAAQVLLGHSRADVAQIYAEKNDALGVAVAAKVG
jgi:site-specific recombinase XerD